MVVEMMIKGGMSIVECRCKQIDLSEGFSYEAVDKEGYLRMFVLDLVLDCLRNVHLWAFGVMAYCQRTGWKVEKYTEKSLHHPWWQLMHQTYY